MSGNEWGDVQGGFDTKDRITDLIVVSDKSKYKRKFKTFRYIGHVHQYKVVWIPIFKNGKPLINKEGRQVTVPKALTNYDREKQKFLDRECPYQELAKKMNKYLDEKHQVNERTEFLANAINREAQDKRPSKRHSPTEEERESGFKDIESKSWTPVEASSMPPTLFRKIKGIMELNTVKKKDGSEVVYSVAHPKYGVDVAIKYDPEEKGGSMYSAQGRARTPLTEEEQKYLVWDIEAAIKTQIAKIKDARIEAERMWKEFAKSLKKGKKYVDEDDDDEEPDDLEDDDDDEKPKRKKKSSVLDDDDDEDEKPRRKKKKVVDDEDEDDEDDEDEKPRRKKKKIVDEDDDELDVDLDDDDDEFSSKSSKKKGKKKKVEDDDDEETFAKRKKKKSRRSSDDDEDEDEMPF